MTNAINSWLLIGLSCYRKSIEQPFLSANSNDWAKIPEILCSKENATNLLFFLHDGFNWETQWNISFKLTWISELTKCHDFTAFMWISCQRKVSGNVCLLIWDNFYLNGIEVILIWLEMKLKFKNRSHFK